MHAACSDHLPQCPQQQCRSTFYTQDHQCVKMFSPVIMKSGIQFAGFNSAPPCGTTLGETPLLSDWLTVTGKCVPSCTELNQFEHIQYLVVITTVANGD